MPPFLAPRTALPSPAMQVRLGLSRFPKLDARLSHIEVHSDQHTNRHVITSIPVRDYPGAAVYDHEHPLFHQYHAECADQAAKLWREKYGTEIPADDDLDVSWAETLLAGMTPYEGPTELTDAELSVVSRADEFGDFTLDMLWLIVECLGWRPGVPVPEDDQGWISVWAEDEEVRGYLDIVRAVLGMPEVPYGYVPPAVVELQRASPSI
ncbi:hypothetical protein L4Z64_001220 [Pseudomonas aeruginosa]|nr:hypothetical protein [Pseudomonas aeruginosa]MCS8414853.1 hypothetical protein [Pseudomonas aeruginosa]MCS9764360.1 hypothetical protein [Pseudomonas aeruginosa]MCS9822400.1 hypothetical protein [Pseudomonas aeruginosa]MCT0241117.1 hypothetical protein [Pseudomonas aeruginosa]